MLESAVANAENNHELIGDDLVVREALRRRRADDQALQAAGEGPRHPILKRTCHLTITLAAERR